MGYSQIGRRDIFTEQKEITRENVIEVIQDTFSDFLTNRADCDFLINFEKGVQPLQREKTVRKEIDIECIDNVCAEVTTFKTSYHWGNEITLVQRGTADSGKTNTAENEAIALLNECFTAEDNKAHGLKLGYFVEVTGIGFTYVDVNTEYDPIDNSSYFHHVVADPRCAYVIRSMAYADHRVIAGVLFREAKNGGARHFTIFTNTQRFEIGSVKRDGTLEYTYWHDIESGQENPLGRVPVIEWVRSYDRTGCFEREISSQNALNIEESDYMNTVDSNVQAIWHANDVDFGMDENGNPKENPKANDWIFTETTRDGKTPFITPLSLPTEYTGMTQSILTKRALILQKCNVPQRNETSGGSTGVAMSDASGWTSAEIEASKQQCFMEEGKMEEVKVALAAIRTSPDVPMDSPLLRLRPADVQPSIKRQKNYELAVKSNAFATLVSHGVHGLHVLRIVNLFDDPQQVYEDSKELIERYQDSVFNKQNEPQEKAAADETDQIVNSPNIDGMTTQEPADDEEE